MLRRTLLEIGAMATLGVNYAATYVVAFIWNFPDPDSELYLHILILFIVSLLFGAVIVDIRKAIFYTIGSIAIGVFLATAIISAPSIILEKNIGLVDTSVTVAFVGITRLFLIGATFVLLGILVGCFIGDAASEET